MKRLLGVYIMTLLIIATSVSSADQEVSPFIEYFPLQTSNSWTYIRTEEPEQTVRYWTRQTLQRSGAVYSVRGRKLPKAGVTTEVYTVGESVELGRIRFWNINISHGARDGRYDHAPEPPRRILWGKRRLEEGNALSIVEETIVRFSTMATIPSEAVHTAELLIAPPREGIGVRVQRGIAEITCHPIRETVNVQAGSFANCLVMIIRVKPDDNSSNDSLQGGWETHSYYAPNVGLVKEVQKNLAGHLTYTLTLKHYRIAPPSEEPEKTRRISTISPVPANSLSAKEAESTAQSVVKPWYPDAALVDILTDRGAYPLQAGTPLPKGGVASGRTIIIGELTGEQGELLGYSVSVDEVPDINRFVNVFRWRCIYKHQEKYLIVLVSKYFVQFQEATETSDVRTVPIQNWEIDTNQAISIAEQNEAIPRGYNFRLAMWKYNDKLLPFWTIPYMLPDQRIFVINATTGQMLIGLEAEKVTPP
jgi:hypothetical protein